MYIRTKKVGDGSKTVVQLVESYRMDGRTKQRVIRHVGTAYSCEELAALKQLATAIKLEQEANRLQEDTVQNNPTYSPELGEVHGMRRASIPVDLMQSQAQSHLTLGIHDIYGFVYEAIGFGNLFSLPKRNEKSARILKEIVLARIAKPLSKLASIRLLHKQFGVGLNIDHIYQMMDKLNESFSERAQERALSSALNLTGEKLQVLFYDATTLYFESFQEDALKQNGYSKDMKFNQPQVLLALFVTGKGLPVGYEVFPGKTYEGHTLKPVLEKLKKRYAIDEIVFVSDSGMLNKENLDYLQTHGYHYVVGARLKNAKEKLKKRVMQWSEKLDRENIKDEVIHELILSQNDSPILEQEEDGASNEEEHHDAERVESLSHQEELAEGSEIQKKLIIAYHPSRAKKDKMDREKAIQKLQARLAKSNNPKKLISNYGFQKFIAVDGESQLKIDEEKLQEAIVWDGIIGVFTNHPTLTGQQALKQYRGLWQVEESFRITKHDLRIRPIYHWTPNRVRAHIAISFMAFVCVRYLEYRVATQYEKISPNELRECLMSVQATILLNQANQERYLMPLPLEPLAKNIYRVLGVKPPHAIMRLSA